MQENVLFLCFSKELAQYRNQFGDHVLILSCTTITNCRLSLNACCSPSNDTRDVFTCSLLFPARITNDVSTEKISVFGKCEAAAEGNTLSSVALTYHRSDTAVERKHHFFFVSCESLCVDFSPTWECWTPRDFVFYSYLQIWLQNVISFCQPLI